MKKLLDNGAVLALGVTGIVAAAGVALGRSGSAGRTSHPENVKVHKRGYRIATRTAGPNGSFIVYEMRGADEVGNVYIVGQVRKGGVEMYPIEYSVMEKALEAARVMAGRSPDGSAARGGDFGDMDEREWHDWFIGTYGADTLSRLNRLTRDAELAYRPEHDSSYAFGGGAYRSMYDRVMAKAKTFGVSEGAAKAYCKARGFEPERKRGGRGSRSEGSAARGHLTKDEVVQMFREEVMPSIRKTYERDGIPDYPARSEAWNNFTDMLHKDGQISSKAYNEWSGPPETSRRRSRD